MALHGLDVLANLTAPSLGALGAARSFVTRRMERVATRDIWRRLRVKGALEQPIESLSGGNQQKVFLGRWLVKGSRLLILDEPTAGIDVGARAEFHELLRGLAADGVSVVMASAEPEEIALVCHRVVVLVAGAIVHELQQPLAPEDVVAASYLGR
jgi:ABC-type sugar transport system ATPase subunit